jgi:hypothetical protein
MPMLGDLLAAARDGAGSFLPWLRIADAQLADDIEDAARLETMAPATFVRVAIADFARFASEEDWATLTSNLKRTDDPGTACLLAMVDWRLNAKACSKHSHSHHSNGGAADERSKPRSA